MLELYYAPQTCSLAPHITLEDTKANYQLHRLSIEAKDHHSDQYLALNSKGRVPTLITPNGALTETPAILVYLAQTNPDAQLAPLDDTFAFAKLQEFNSFIASTLHVAHAHRMRGHRWADEESAIVAMQKKVPETVAAGFRHIESEYLAGPYVMGDHYTVADAYLFTLAQWMESDGVKPSDFGKVQAHREMMQSRPSVQKALKDQIA